MYQFSPSPVALHLLTTAPAARRRRVRTPHRWPRPASTDTFLSLSDDS